MNADYTGKGVDQLADCINKIKKTPEDRRIIMTAWNPVDLDKMALPPCHMFCQFYVANGELSCLVSIVFIFQIVLIIVFNPSRCIKDLLTWAWEFLSTLPLIHF